VSIPPRENLALRREESWRPPVFAPNTGRLSRAAAGVRRFFDLQAASIWRDLTGPLSMADGTLVDVGCGAQPYRRLLPAKARYVGLDTASAADDFGYGVPDVRVIAEDGAWPVGDGEADIVLATETLEHVPDPAAFVTEAQRVLRPGGRLILTVPFAARWHFIPHDYWRFTPSGLSLLLSRGGFQEIVVHGRGNETTVAAYKVLALLLGVALRQDESRRLYVGLRTLALAPLIFLLATIGQRSLRQTAGDDCLGYTVHAVRG
jgi:SAM-dependent methyltransferase